MNKGYLYPAFKYRFIYDVTNHDFRNGMYLYNRLSDLETIIKSYLHYVSSQDTGVSQESISPSGLDSMYKKLAVLAKTFEAGGAEHEGSD